MNFSYIEVVVTLSLFWVAYNAILQSFWFVWSYKEHHRKHFTDDIEEKILVQDNLNTNSEGLYIALFNNNVELSYSGYERQPFIYDNECEGCETMNIEDITFPKYKGWSSSSVDTVIIMDKNGCILNGMKLNKVMRLCNEDVFTFAKGNISISAEYL